MDPNAMLSKQHTEAIKSASTEADKVKRAAAAMIETPMDLIRTILQRHEESVIEVMRELDVEKRRLDNLTGDLSMLVVRLSRALAKADPTSALPAAATDFLTRHGLQGSPLRAEGAEDTTG